MSLVKVPVGDGWMYELPCGPNKGLTPLTLTFGPSSHQTRPAGVSDLVKKLKEEQELIQV